MQTKSGFQKVATLLAVIGLAACGGDDEPAAPAVT